jgi:hypothetical protein
VSGDVRQPSRPELLAELEALLARAGNAQRRRRPPAELERPPLPASAPPSSETPWQRYANELRDLCRRVGEEADEETAVAFWIFLVEMAAWHGPRAGDWPT